MKLKGLLKLALSLIMIYMVLRLVELRNLKQVLLNIPIQTALLVLFTYFVGQLFSSFKWWQIAKSSGIQVSYFQTVKAYFIGMFVNCFGFGTVGGDLARALLLNDGHTSKASALGSVAADRAHGLSVLACIALLAFVFSKATLDSTLLLLIFLIPLFVILGWLFGPPLVFKILPEDSYLGKLSRQLFSAFPRDFKTLLIITIVSTIFHLLQISVHMIMAIGLGIEIPWAALLTTIPFVNMLASLPISWNGLGLRENAYHAFLVPLYLSDEQAIAMGAMWLFAVVVSSAVGGIFSVLTKDQHAKIEATGPQPDKSKLCT